MAAIIHDEDCDCDATTATMTPSEKDPTSTVPRMCRPKPQPRQLNRHERRKEEALKRKALKQIKGKLHGKPKAKNHGNTGCTHGFIPISDFKDL